MCIIQNYTFVLNGTIPSLLTCQAKHGDTIQLKADVMFEVADIGLSAKVALVVVFPDSTEIEFHAPTHVVSTEGVQSFIIDITNTAMLSGTYTLVGTIVYDYAILTQRCMLTTPQYGCNSLTVSGGCSGCNPDTNMCLLNYCIPKDYLLAGAAAYLALSLIKS